jgi:hypothetical protein
MTVLDFKVGYTDVPRTPRGRLEHDDLRARIAELESELHALDRGGALPTHGSLTLFRKPRIKISRIFWFTNRCC